MTDYDFAFVDVFADEPLAGNALPVVPHADGLSRSQRQAIAREFNQPETTFVSAATRAGADAWLQSFTPTGDEVTGAGHNALGAWLWLAISGTLPPDRSEFVQQLGEHLLDVRVERTGSGSPVVTLTQAPPVFLAELGDTGPVADALGIAPDRVTGAARVVSTGVAHLLVPVNDRTAVDAARPSPRNLAATLTDVGAQGCYLYTTAAEPGGQQTDAYARFFNPGVGIWEDPATGSAAGPLAAHLATGRNGATRWVIEQGTAIGRRSLLRVQVDGSSVRLCGRGTLTIDGTLHLAEERNL
ncbi:MAG TPA: PhzF family phenazine biosynthesis protein [Amycolatopsis sp.]|nr:PhzF family phenazine biosynthesis protein [Amycolatopsis sp.]